MFGRLLEPAAALQPEIWRSSHPLFGLLLEPNTVLGRYVITPLDAVNGYPVRIIIEPKGGAVQVHVLVNAYAPMGANGPVAEAQRIQGQIRRDEVLFVNTRKAGELLGRSGLQLPRVPSLNTDRKKILTEKNLAGYLSKEACRQLVYPGPTRCLCGAPTSGHKCRGDAVYECICDH